MTETTLAYSLGRHTCAHSCSKVMRKALAPARCRQIDLADPPRRFAYAEDARNACLTSSPVQPWGTARRAKCMLHRGITSMAGCVRRARCPVERPSLTTREVAALRGASRPQPGRLVRRGAVAANHDVENGARGARLERHRRHQTSVVRAFSTVRGPERGSLRPEIVGVGLTRW